MFNSIQVIGLLLLGGLTCGEIAKRFIGLPRATAYVLFGFLMGQGGFSVLSVQEIDQNPLLVNLALGLILFELGYRVPRCDLAHALCRLRQGLAAAVGGGLLLLLLFHHLGFSFGPALFSAALCLAASPAITIATDSEVDAHAAHKELVYTLVVINCLLAFALIALTTPFLNDIESLSLLARISASAASLFGALILGGACAGIVLMGAEWLNDNPMQQHLLVLGTIILGVGMASYLAVPVMLPMLLFGLLVRAIDYEDKLVASSISSDTQFLLLITFLIAGAALDLSWFRDYWPEALLIVFLRLLGQFAGLWLLRGRSGLSLQEGLKGTLGLQAMSSVALILLSKLQTQYTGLDSRLVGMLLATIWLMQLLGPLTSRLAITGSGKTRAPCRERTHLPSTGEGS